MLYIVLPPVALPIIGIKPWAGAERVLLSVAQAMELLSKGPDVTVRERELLRAVPEPEVISAMIGNVKMAMPGLARIKTEARRSKKTGKA